MNLWERQTKHFEDSKIIEVYKDNFKYEMNQITKLIDEGFNFIGLDTEFPGIVFFPKFEEKYKTFFVESIKNNSELIQNYNYDTIKLNVNNLKLIQVGFCLYNSTKNEKRTWQFNLDFDIREEKFSNSSIELLQKSGINFAKMQEEGIELSLFAETLLVSGLVQNNKITWVTFHGTYDFAYFIKLLTNENLPKEESTFLETIDFYFPNFYDVKFLLRNSCYNNCGLIKLSKHLNISINGSSHQAGSDSLVTIEIFISLKKRNFLQENLQKENNILWGTGLKFDSSKILEYLLKNPTFYSYYYTNSYYQMTDRYRNDNNQLNYITEKKPKTNNYYGV